MWFPLLFKYPRDAYDNAALVFTRPGDPDWWLAGGLLVCLIIIGSVLFGTRTRHWPLWRRASIALFQTAFALGALALLAAPALEISLMRAGTNIVAVLIDTSRSMGFPAGETPGSSRLDAASDILTQELLPSLAPMVEVATYRFDNAVSRVDGELAPSGDQTRLMDAVSNVIAGYTREPLAAVIVLSDGMDNRSGAQVAAAPLFSDRQSAVPVHTIGFGTPNLPGEVRLTNVTMPAEAAVGSVVTARVTIAHHLASGGTAMLSVRDGQRLLQKVPVALTGDQPNIQAEISFLGGNAGIHDLLFELTPTPGDSLTENNRVRRLLTVNERKRRVLYLEGEPRWEYKFLRRALAKDDVLELTSWLRTTDRKTYRQGVTREDEIADGLPEDPASAYLFDVIILGSLPATELTPKQHEWLEDFVAVRGGSVLVLAGRQALADGGWDVQPLADALPVAISRSMGTTYSVLTSPAIIEATAAGLRSELTRLTGNVDQDWGTLPSLGDLQYLGALKPAATTLLEVVNSSGRHPLLITQPYGLGTTAILATSTTWRWQMRTPPDDARHRSFWRQLLRQLAESARRPRDLNVDVNPSGELAIRATASDVAPGQAHLRARITGPDGSEASVKLAPEAPAGSYLGQHATGVSGIYRVDLDIVADGTVDSRTRFVQVGSDDIEFTHPGQNEALLRRLAETTGGRYWSPAEVRDIGEHLRYSSQGIRTIEYLPLWDMPVLLLMLLAIKLSEWWLRRYWGQI